jgi:hypothetical protein
LGNAGIGLEKTVEEYVANIVAAFREVWRVLRNDGTCWINLGDSYSGGGRGNYDMVSENKGNAASRGLGRPAVPGLKPKDLVGVPWRVAFALQQPFYTGRIRTEADRIWLAAMIDGEGCMFIHKRKAGQSNGQGYERKHDTFGAGLEVANTHLSIIERCMEIVGQGSICHQDKETAHKFRNLRLYRWSMRSNECREIVREVYPYLTAKKHEARLLLGCPPSGELAERTHAGLIALHNGKEADIDFPEPASMYKPGWYLRSDIIWSKNNPMPESVTDRPTKAHEYLFLLAKQPRYYFDSAAIAEPSNHAGRVLDYTGEQKNNEVDPVLQATRPRGRKITVGATRNRRDVWVIPTSLFKGAHFAVFPPALVEPCILAGTSAKGVCPECGAQWERVMKAEGGTIGRSWHDHKHDGEVGQRAENAAKGGNGYRRVEVGWRPTCDHGGDWRLVATPTGEVEDVDPTMETGRAGMNRPRGQNEGRRPMYVWAQRAYAGQLQNSPHRPEMEQEAGSAFEHYIRTDESGARPVPPDLLAHWLENGWLTEPHEPPPPLAPVPAVVLDPFCGSGTVGQVCRKHGRKFVGLDLSMKYLRELALPRAEGTQAAGANADLPLFGGEACTSP